MCVFGFELFDKVLRMIILRGCVNKIFVFVFNIFIYKYKFVIKLESLLIFVFNG